MGWLYALNTAGAIGGATLAGFWLIPTAGIQGAIKIGILVNVAAGAGLLLIRWTGPMKRLVTVSAAVVAVAGVLAVPRWDPSVMTSAPAIYGSYYVQSATGVAEPLRSNEVVFYRDGPSATVAVTRLSEYLSLRVNGKVDASTAPPDMPNQLLSGHLPLLLLTNLNPRAVLLIGLGSGITAGAVARHPVERLDVVEIEKAVVDASRFFVEEHGGVLTDNRVRVIVADGRSFLATAPGRYDVIISEPSNPWIAGLASLFTVEYFDLARRRLNPGGMMLQWLQAYNLEPDDVRMILRTFQSVFPATSLWHSGGADLLLLGKADSTPIDLGVIKDHYARSAAVQRDLRRIGDLGWPSVLGHFLLGDSDTRGRAAAAGLNTDDRLALEFSAPRSLYLETEGKNLAWITGCKIAEFPEVKPETRAYLDQPDVQRSIGLAMLARGARGVRPA